MGKPKRLTGEAVREIANGGDGDYRPHCIDCGARGHLRPQHDAYVIAAELESQAARMRIMAGRYGWTGPLFDPTCCNVAVNKEAAKLERRATRIRKGGK